MSWTIPEGIRRIWRCRAHQRVISKVASVNSRTPAEPAPPTDVVTDDVPEELERGITGDPAGALPRDAGSPDTGTGIFEKSENPGDTAGITTAVAVRDNSMVGPRNTTDGTPVTNTCGYDDSELTSRG